MSFVRTLPVFLSSLFARLAPNASDRVDFTGLHKLAARILSDRGGRVKVDAGGCLTGLTTRPAQRMTWQSVLADLVDNPTYWKEEIDYVVKGRGLSCFEDYDGLTRVGRRTPMRGQHRQVLWDLRPCLRG